MKTAITEMFGIKYPIICGAMMWLCKPTLCAAISNAGGMGNLTAANYETEEGFRNAIRETRKLTDRPFMVGITILPSVRITAGHHQMYLRVCAEEKVAGIEVSGAPVDKAVGPEYVDMLKKQALSFSQGGIGPSCPACPEGGLRRHLRRRHRGGRSSVGR